MDEGRTPIAMPVPDGPSIHEREEHELTHIPFRSWCRACVRGRAKAQPHFAHQEKESETVSTFSVDYGYFGTPGGAEPVPGKDMPILIAFDRKSKAIFAHPVPHKGLKAEDTNQPDKVDEYPVKVLVRDLDRLGYKKVNGKSDQERSIVAVCKAVKATWKGEWVQEFSPRYVHQSNGEVERAVQTVHGLARTLKDHVEQYARIELDARSPMIAWIIEHAANLHFLFHHCFQGLPHLNHSTSLMHLLAMLKHNVNSIE